MNWAIWSGDICAVPSSPTCRTRWYRSLQNAASPPLSATTASSQSMALSTMISSSSLTHSGLSYMSIENFSTLHRSPARPGDPDDARAAGVDAVHRGQALPVGELQLEVRGDALHFLVVPQHLPVQAAVHPVDPAES